MAIYRGKGGATDVEAEPGNTEFAGGIIVEKDAVVKGNLTVNGEIYGDGSNLTGIPSVEDTYTKDEIDASQAEQDVVIDTKLGDAPADGIMYGRKDSLWQTLPVGDNVYTKAEIDVQQAEQDANILANADGIADLNAETYDKIEIDDQQLAQDVLIQANTDAIASLPTPVDTYTKSEIDASQNAQDTVISTNTGNISNNTTAIGDLSGRVLQNEEDIEVLNEGMFFSSTYEARYPGSPNRTPGTGDLYLQKNSAFTYSYSECNIIYVSKTDQMGNVRPYTALQVGDKLILNQGDGSPNFGRYKVLAIDKQTEFVVLTVSYVIGQGSVINGDTVGLQAFPASSGGSGDGIPEAPIDGKQYGRQDATWTEVTGGGDVTPSKTHYGALTEPKVLPSTSETDFKVVPFAGDRWVDGKFIADTKGSYDLNVGLSWSLINPIADQTFRRCILFVNGAVISTKSHGIEEMYPHGSKNESNWVIDLEAGDEVEIKALQQNTQGGDQNVANTQDSYVRIAMLGGSGSGGGETPTPEALVWEDRTVARALDTVYTNTNDVPLYVQITAYSDGATNEGINRIDFQIDGKAQGSSGSNGDKTYDNTLYVVPSGSTFSAVTKGVVRLDLWQEAKMPLAIAVGGASGGGTTDILPVLLSGTVFEDGVIGAGEDFTCNKTGTGKYTITFNTPRTTLDYSVTALTNTSYVRSISVANKSETKFDIWVRDSSSNDFVDGTFDLTVTGTEPISVGGGSNGGGETVAFRSGGIVAGQTPTTNADYSIQFDTPETSEGGTFDGTYFTPNTEGWYQLSGSVFISAPTSSRVGCIIQKNGSSQLGSFNQGITALGGGGISTSGLVYCNGTTDKLSLAIVCNEAVGAIGGATNTTWFSAHLVTGQSSGGSYTPETFVWEDKKLERDFATYTNDWDVPRYVEIGITGLGDTDYAYTNFLIDGKYHASLGKQGLNTRDMSQGMFIVPAGSTYTLEKDGNAVIGNWWEARMPVALGAGGSGTPSSFARIVDKKAKTVAGGSSVAGIQVRDLNTIQYDDDNIVSLSGNDFTLQAGTYVINYSAPANRVEAHNVNLFDVTDNATVNVGTINYSLDNASNTSYGNYSVTLTEPHTYRVTHQTEVAKASNGLGSLNPVTDGIFTTVDIQKVGSGGSGSGDSIWTDVDGVATYDGDVNIKGGTLDLRALTTGADFSTIKSDAENGINFDVYGSTRMSIKSGGVTTSQDMTVFGVTVGKGKGNLNTVLGDGALSANTTGGDTVAVGNGALRLNNTGSRNTAVGYNSLTKATNVKENTAIGWGALAKATEGSVNTSVGDSSLANLETGGYNTAVGNAALTSVTTGDQNVGIGRSAGNQLTTGSNVICIGYNSNPSSPSVSNEVTIGNDSITSTRLKGTVTSNGTPLTTALDVDTAIDRKLAIKDKLIEKLSARLDELEQKFNNGGGK